MTFDDSAQEVLLQYSWPYNVRELADLVEEMTTLKRNGIVSAADLPAKYSPSLQITIPQDGLDLKGVIGAIELSLIDQALRKTQGNKQQASKLLGIKRTTLIEKMKKRGIKNRNGKEAFAD